VSSQSTETLLKSFVSKWMVYINPQMVAPRTLCIMLWRLRITESSIELLSNQKFLLKNWQELFSGSLSWLFNFYITQESLIGILKLKTFLLMSIWMWNLQILGVLIISLIFNIIKLNLIHQNQLELLKVMLHNLQIIQNKEFTMGMKLISLPVDTFYLRWLWKLNLLNLQIIKTNTINNWQKVTSIHFGKYFQGNVNLLISSKVTLV